MVLRSLRSFSKRKQLSSPAFSSTSTLHTAGICSNRHATTLSGFPLAHRSRISIKALTPLNACYTRLTRKARMYSGTAIGRVSKTELVLLCMYRGTLIRKQSRARKEPMYDGIQQFVPAISSTQFYLMYRRRYDVTNGPS